MNLLNTNKEPSSVGKGIQYSSQRLNLIPHNNFFTLFFPSKNSIAKVHMDSTYPFFFLLKNSIVKIDMNSTY